LVQNLT